MAADSDFQVLPLEDTVLPPEDDVASAVASAIDEDTGLPDVRAPYGRAHEFDFRRGRFIRSGLRPAEARGLRALAMRCAMAVNVARGAHPTVDPDFGMDEPDRGIGDVDPSVSFADFEDRLRSALMRVDGVASVANVVFDYDPTTGVYAGAFDVFTLDDLSVTVGPLAISDLGPDDA